jgi:hypothetical protein
MPSKCASFANLAPVNDEPEDLGFSKRRHRSSRAILRLARDLPRIFEFGQ